ncbi:MAG: hypothetical protein M3O77_07140 [Chloroflexota bacterium]|nr:hypothetical protein [Chloroflexota bacterium]
MSLLLIGRRRVLIDGGLIAALDGEAERLAAAPADLLGLLTDRGRIEPGMRADLVLLDDDLAVAATFVGGQSMYVRKDQAWR